MPRVQIRPLREDAEYRQCEYIQKAVWGTLGVSSELLSVTQKHGGAVLGSITRGKVVGFLYAFLARRHGRLVHWSHMMAVEEKYRNLGLGFRMKLVHRELALAQGLSAICWTFDPLQSRNAALNIARLGGRVDEYIPDCYGQFPSMIEKGLPSDRFAVEWRIRSAGIQKRLSQKDSGYTRLAACLTALPCANQTYSRSGRFIENRRLDLHLQGSLLAVEIPPNTDLMRQQALPLARRWRMETRRIFTYYLQAGYRVKNFVPPGPETENRCFYILGRSNLDRAKRRRDPAFSASG
jgi:predicted GNAT superfamily acetyltransferase